MAASPIKKSRATRARVEPAIAAARQRNCFDGAIRFWRGTSGHAYVHTVYSLRSCPAIPPASALLVRNLGQGQGLLVLKVLCLDDIAPSLNLAQIRHVGSNLGANEVHLHFAAGDQDALQTAAFDLAMQHENADIVGL